VLHVVETNALNDGHIRWLEDIPNRFDVDIFSSCEGRDWARTLVLDSPEIISRKAFLKVLVVGDDGLAKGFVAFVVDETD
jgi:hypothetical protein